MCHSVMYCEFILKLWLILLNLSIIRMSQLKATCQGPQIWMLNHKLHEVEIIPQKIKLNHKLPEAEG